MTKRPGRSALPCFSPWKPNRRSRHPRRSNQRRNERGGLRPRSRFGRWRDRESDRVPCRRRRERFSRKTTPNHSGRRIQGPERNRARAAVWVWHLSHGHVKLRQNEAWGLCRPSGACYHFHATQALRPGLTHFAPPALGASKGRTPSWPQTPQANSPLCLRVSVASVVGLVFRSPDHPIARSPDSFQIHTIPVLYSSSPGFKIIPYWYCIKLLVLGVEPERDACSD